MKKNIKWILLIIDIISIIGIGVSYYAWYNKNKSLDDSTLAKNQIKYKKFIINLPEDVSYYVFDDYTFVLETEAYKAYVEIIAHNDTNMLKNPDLYYDEVTSLGLNISKGERIKIDDIDMIKYEKFNDNDDNSALYYFSYDEDFDYEVELFGDEGNLTSVLDILLNVVYDESSKTPYNYIMWSYDEVED